MLVGGMDNATLIRIPQQALMRLEFLAGEYTGTQTMQPPGGKAVSYEAVCTVSREVCERFLKIEFYAQIPEHGIETFTAFLTYSEKKNAYEMWLFSSAAEEPLHMTGDFKNRRLVMVSDPWLMSWGLQRIRGTFTAHPDGAFEYVTDLWEPDGYTRFRSTIFRKRPLSV